MRHLLLLFLIAGCKTYSGEDTEFAVGDADADADTDTDTDTDSDTGDTGI